MAGYEDAENEWSRIEKAIRTSLRHLRGGSVWISRRQSAERAPLEGQGESAEVAALQRFPVEVQLYIMALLAPIDLCRLGCVSRYWNAAVRDPLLWRYFLLRDLPGWNSVDHLSLPDAAFLRKSLTEGAEQDYMTAYLRSSPEGRKHWKLSHPASSSMTSFFYSLVPQAEPRFAMFGPGLEQLDSSLVTKMMNSPGLLPLATLPQRQIDGIGSGISFLFNSTNKFNILTLYSTTCRNHLKTGKAKQTLILQKEIYPRIADRKTTESQLFSLKIEGPVRLKRFKGFDHVTAKKHISQ
ncbi:F-box only protein 4 [Scyliorhinus canicula]|uniref:F-box only protein 4 n=1 Tax=Scyliorhinus canicula TaxID=7830 RepID=UPI0018F5213A|nr:F-box only protein 4 [Scyliorhinus canicula]